MAAKEEDLADNAPWKKIQQNTFTRWVNEHLKCVNMRIADLQLDLGDGLRLIALLEVLSHKLMFKTYNKRPNFRQMKLENVSVALEFLEKEEIKLVSIDSKAIVDGNLKLILGLVWTLIMHYSISTVDCEDEAKEAESKTPKQRLLGWIQHKVPDLPINNFRQDWSNGRALGALVDSCAPGLCPDWESWDPVKPVENASEAMQLADDWLGVPQVIAPEEIIHPSVDEQSVMTYLSQFHKAKPKPGTPLKPKLNRAYGPGIEPTGNRVLRPAVFTVDTFSAGQGQVTVYLDHPDGTREELGVEPNEGKKTFNVTYIPRVMGLHKVTVTSPGQSFLKNTFEVNVDRALGDQVMVEGLGIKPVDNFGNKPTYFDIYTAGNRMDTMSDTSDTQSPSVDRSSDDTSDGTMDIQDLNEPQNRVAQLKEGTMDIQDMNEPQNRVAQLKAELHRASLDLGDTEQVFYNLRRELLNAREFANTVQRNCLDLQEVLHQACLAPGDTDQVFHHIQRELLSTQEMAHTALLEEYTKEWTAQILYLQGQLGKLQTDVGELLRQESNICTTREKLNCAHEMILNLQHAMGQAEEERERAITALQAELDNVQSELKHWRDMVAVYEGEISQLQKSFTLQQAECVALQQQSVSLQQDCDSLRGERETLTDRLHHLETELSSTREQSVVLRTNLRDKLVSLKNQHLQDADKLKSQLDQAQAHTHTLQKEYEDTQSQLLDLRQRYERTEEEKLNIHQELEQCRSSLKLLQDKTSSSGWSPWTPVIAVMVAVTAAVLYPKLSKSSSI